MIVTATILTLTYAHIKMPQTANSDNRIVQIISLTFIYTGINACNSYFGPAGINPALAAAYIAYETSEHAYEHSSQVNHYLWVYMISPFVGAAIGGILWQIHSRCVSAKGRDNSVSIE